MPEYTEYSPTESKNDELTEAEKGVYIDEWLNIITRITTNEINNKYAINQDYAIPAEKFDALTELKVGNKQLENYPNTGVTEVGRTDYNFILENKLVTIKLRSETHANHSVYETSIRQAENNTPVISIDIFGSEGEYESIDIYYKGEKQIEYHSTPSRDGIKRVFTSETAQRITKLLEEVSFAEPASPERVEKFPE